MEVAVLGAGHGGLATAGHIALKGHSVRVFSFFEREIEAILHNGGIRLEGDVEGFAAPKLVTTSIDEAIVGADLIMVVMPAFAHKNIASLLAACIEDDQVLLLTPGRTGGALEVYHTWRRHQVKKKVILAECQTFLYATESRGPAHVEIMKVKNRVRASALPATDTSAFMNIIGHFYPEYAAATNVLETSINNTGAVVHPAPMLMNSGLLERAARGEDLRYYKDIITEFVCTHVMEKIDREKSEIARAFGVPVFNVRQWYRECYDVEGESLYEVLQNNPYYLGFSAPKHALAYHHVLDEVPNSLVPLCELGSLAGVEAPMTSAIVDLASAALSFDFWLEGRTPEKLGLAETISGDILDFVNQGRRFWEHR
jgi:opine dehydrogenase